MKKQNFIFGTVLALIMMTLCSCENETAVALNGAWRSDNSNEYVKEIITFTKKHSNGGTLRESTTLEVFDYDGTRYGFEMSMTGDWHVEDGQLFVSYDENSITTQRHNQNIDEEIEALINEVRKSYISNAREFNQSYYNKTFVEGFHMNSDTHFSWIVSDEEGNSEVESFTKM